MTVGNAKSVDLLNDFVGLSLDTAVDTVAEIDAAACAAYNVMVQAGMTSTTPAAGSAVPAIYTTDTEWIAGLIALGITGVDASNISAIKTVIAGSAGTGADVDTVAEVQALVSLARLKAFTDDPGVLTGSPAKSAAIPALTDWTALGAKAFASLNDTAPTQDLTGSSTNLTAINSALDRLDGSSLTTVGTAMPKLQDIVSSYARVLAEADGTRATDFSVNSTGTDANDPAQTDYENILGGSANLTTLTSGSTTWLGLLNDSIGGLSTTAVDTASELENLIKASVNVMKQAAATSGTAWSYTTDADWVSALTSLGVNGLSGMSSTNLASVKSAITDTAPDGSGVDTWAELQGIVSLIRINDYAVSSTNSTPVFSDYQAFFTYGVTTKTDIANTSTYLGAFNDAVNYKQTNNFTPIELKNMVNSYSAILAEANGSSSDQQTYDPIGTDYTNVGVGSAGTSFDAAIQAMLGVSDYAALLTDVVAGKVQAEVDTVSELNDLALIVTKVQQLEAKATGAVDYSNISGGALQVSELTKLGLDTTNLTSAPGLSNPAAALQHRLTDVYDHIIAASGPSAVDTLAELQALINNTNTIIA